MASPTGRAIARWRDTGDGFELALEELVIGFRAFKIGAQLAQVLVLDAKLRFDEVRARGRAAAGVVA